MITRADKTRDPRALLPASTRRNQRVDGDSLQFVDNRPESLAQRKLQEAADCSPRVTQGAGLRLLADEYSSRLVNGFGPRPQGTFSGGGRECVAMGGQRTGGAAAHAQAKGAVPREGSLEKGSGTVTQTVAGNGRVVQRVPLLARVAWGITHLVREIDGSIFGAGKFDDGEIGPDGELKSGQNLIVETEDVFVSRRGANQENESRREEDRKKPFPDQRWLRVLLVNFRNVEKEKLYVREETVAPEDRPGKSMIELGAGPMSSAASSWMKQRDTAFTELRSEEELDREYGRGFRENVAKTTTDDPLAQQNNAIMFGVNATQEGAYEGLPLTESLRFTNPNIGADDVKAFVLSVVKPYMDGGSEAEAEYRSMGMTFRLNLALAIPKPKTREAWGPWISNTTNMICNCRNVKLIHDFMWNAPEKLMPGTGRVEMIVSTSYLARWPIRNMATAMGYQMEQQDGYELGFENVKTQKDEDVGEGRKAPKKTLITLTPPWGGEMTTAGALSFCRSFTADGGYRKSNLLQSVEM